MATDERKPGERPKVKIQFKGGVADKRSGAHGLFRWSFSGKGPFEVYAEDYRDHLERTGLFEFVAEKPPTSSKQGQSGGQSGGGQSGSAGGGGEQS